MKTEKQPKRKTSYTFEFNTPSQLKNTKPIEKVSKCIEKLHKKIGYEQVNMRMQAILTEWGLQSGYRVTKTGSHFVFDHVSTI